MKSRTAMPTLLILLMTFILASCASPGRTDTEGNYMEMEEARGFR